MRWFSLWLPFLTQLVIPIILLTALILGRHTTSGRSIAITALVAAYIVAIGVAGLWLVLPWWLPFVYLGIVVGTIARRLRRSSQPFGQPRGTGSGLAVTVLSGFIAVLFMGITALALTGRRDPGHVIDLSFPLGSGTYLVVNGGSQALINAHLTTLTGERFAAYRGQSYGVDLVRINAAGLRVLGVLPPDPAAYLIFGDPVLAPCGGRVVLIQNDAPDMSPPTVDRAHMSGNHVILDCGPAWIVLGHLRRGSVLVQTGQSVKPRQRLGLVGNSGNTGEPHLHVHAQLPGPLTVPLSGQPVAVRFKGRYLVRNDRVHASRETE